ncbi:hypothetical protein F4779DRAFT_364769 [Xylariaceae sp. FL0662B]|nr:hypothetical protein F4779DRAFT_364769 [Xylariaceae sp. FL0662B]
MLFLYYIRTAILTQSSACAYLCVLGTCTYMHQVLTLHTYVGMLHVCMYLTLVPCGCGLR